MDYYIVITTTNDKQKGIKIAKELVDKQFAACVNIIPNIISVYKWKNKTEIADEYILLIKTTEYKLKGTMDKIKSIHNYELPEIISFKIDNGYKNYFEWIKDTLGGKK